MDICNRFGFANLSNVASRTIVKKTRCKVTYLLGIIIKNNCQQKFRNDLLTVNDIETDEIQLYKNYAKHASL